MFPIFSFIYYNSDTDNERDAAKDKLRKYVQLKRRIQENANVGNGTDGNIYRTTAL